MNRFSDFEGWPLFCLNTAEQIYQQVSQTTGVGTEVIAHRESGYRETDPDIIGMDKILEDLILNRLESTRHSWVVLTEEKGRVELNPGLTSPFYAVVDPLDGSALYRRQIPAFWLSAMGLWEGNTPLGSFVVNLITGQIDFINQNKSYTGSFNNQDRFTYQPMKLSGTTQLNESYVETYLMKPHALYAGTHQYQKVLEQCKFVLPNGGPGGFTDVARGTVDLYLARGEGITECYSSLAIAQCAGAAIASLTDKPLDFEDNIHKTYDLAVASTPELLKSTLSLLLP